MNRLPPLVAVVAALLAGPVAAAELTVDLDTVLKPVDHAASGSLYGLADEGWPADKWIASIHPRNFTQMAPGGGQLPNGETSPVGDALTVAPIAARHGASITVRMPDVFPSFPYVWQGDAFWIAGVKVIATAVVASEAPNIYAYEIWNEPDWDWKPEWGDFDAMWAATFHTIRGIDPSRPIMGPSAAAWNADWFRRFFTSAIASGTVPQIVSWHELDPAQEGDVGAHVAAYRALEKELGIGPLPISINEYGAPRDAAVPGALTRMVARLERAGVDTADLAFWHRPGRLADLLVPIKGGRGPARDAVPTGAFWVYAWYGEMTGKMVAVTPSASTETSLDGFASFDPLTNTARIVFGGEAGNHTLTVTGLGGFGPTVTAQISVTHWTGTDGSEATPEALSAATLPVVDGAVSIHVTALAGDAYSVVLTPPETAAPFTPTPQKFSERLEAEAAAHAGARVFHISMSPGNFFANTVSGNSYVGLLDRKEVSLTFTASVPASGPYQLSFGYSNGLADSATYQISIDGSAPQPLSFAPTQGRELIGRATIVVPLAAGTHTIALSAGPNSPKGSLLPSLLEIDYLDVTAD